MLGHEPRHGKSRSPMVERPPIHRTHLFLAAVVSLWLCCVACYSGKTSVQTATTEDQLNSDIQRGDADAVKKDLDNGFDANALNSLDGIRRNSTPLHLAASSGNVVVVTLLLEKGMKPDIKLADGTTPLMTASSKGHADVVTVLLKKGANPNLEEVQQVYEIGTRTPLAYACVNGDPATIEALLDGGAAINGPSGGMAPTMSPLRMAISNENTSAVKLLLKKGAMIGLLDVELARQHPDIAAILAKSPARQRRTY